MSFPRLPAAALSLAALALIAAGCGGSSMTSSSSSSQPSKVPVSSGGGSSGATATTVSAASNPELGMILVDPNGLTLYDFQKDNGTKSACSGECAKIWPPLTTTGAPQAGEGAMSSKLGTSKRSDGTTQVTYEGHPLYTYSADGSPGETNGNGITSFGGSWHALESSGAEAEASAGGGGEAAAAATKGGSESSEESGGGGYGY
jgi:predicted lipoprotein with Yx(FWY)xxD motif